MATSAPSARPGRLTFLDLPPETRVMIYKLTCSTFTVHVRPRFLTPDRQLLEQPTIVTLTNCNVLSLSKQIRYEALPYVTISPTIQLCRSAVVEIHQSVARRLDNTGHSETTCHFLSHISSKPCDLHQTLNFSLLTSDDAAVEKYFILAFDAIQKPDCNVLAMIWIKLIERDRRPLGPHGSIFGFAPPWWPEDVAYAPPDLLNDDGELSRTSRSRRSGTEMTDVDRIHLLSHLLLNAGSDGISSHHKRLHSRSVTDLELSTWRHVSEMQNPNTAELLEEIFKVRHVIERLRHGDSAETILSGGHRALQKCIR